MESSALIIKGARQNNLKNLEIEIPHNKLTVITGPSGSGKSSLAFDTIFAEGQRLYIESLSTYARQFLERVQRPDVDTIKNISPTIAIEQKNTIRNSRSTVGTSTEIYDYLRLLFSKIGKIECPHCRIPIKKDSISDIVEFVLGKLKDTKILVLAPFSTENMPPSLLIKTLLKKGFSRILLKNEIVDLDVRDGNPLALLRSTRDDKIAEKELLVLVDRLEIKPTIKDALTDSLEIAYQETHGRAWIQDEKKKLHKFSLQFRCSQCDFKFPDILPSFFSFNNPYGACAHCKGFGNNLKIDEDLVVPNPNLSLEEGAIDPWTKPSLKRWHKRLLEFSQKENIPITTPYKKLEPLFKKKIFEGTKTFKGILKFFNRLEEKKYKMAVRVFLSRYKSAFLCPQCQGKRLRKSTDFVKVHGKTISDILRFTLQEAKLFFDTLRLSPYEKNVCKEILRQITERLNFLNSVGVGYLTLDRLYRTLSGGEAQRINIANQLGAKLMQTTYVLDEPSIGLHPRDNHLLMKLLRELRDLGNTVIVVEHEPDIIRNSDYLIELGPQGGEKGGHLIYQGTYKNFLKQNTLTSSYLNNAQCSPLPLKRRTSNGSFLKLSGVTHNNLKSVDLILPLEQFICITGVSGSGKSSLIHDTLYNALARIFKVENNKIGRFKTISGFNRLKTVRLIDQEPLSKSPRSNPVTYMKAYDDIRTIFAAQSESIRRGYSASFFSFNIKGGRCDSCEGSGFQKLEMHFMADIFLVCEYCHGKKFKKEILDIKYRGKNVDEVLAMTIDEAYVFFSNTTTTRKKLKILQEVGLGYLKLGQPATTLSGGESQRLKIAKELSFDMEKTLYILDEPTTGLHMDDVKKLLTVLNRLVDQKNTVLVVEHNLDVIKTADYVVDLGPEGGNHGGEIVAQGTPEDIIKVKKSYTGQYLKKVFLS